MSAIRDAVGRYLEAERVGAPGVKVYPGYRALPQQAPAWWDELTLAEKVGEPIGIHEDTPGQRTGAFVVTTNGLLVLGARGQQTWVPYEEIVRWTPPRKEPPSSSVWLHRIGGPDVELCLSTTGRALAFVRFLLALKRITLSASTSSDPDGE